MFTDADYVIFVALLLAVLGAGLLRVGLMNLKGEPRGRLLVALGIVLGIAAVLILVLRALKRAISALVAGLQI